MAQESDSLRDKSMHISPLQVHIDHRGMDIILSQNLDIFYKYYCFV